MSKRRTFFGEKEEKVVLKIMHQHNTDIFCVKKISSESSADYQFYSFKIYIYYYAPTFLIMKEGMYSDTLNVKFDN